MAKDAGALSLRSKLIKEALEGAKKKLQGLEPRFRGFLDNDRLSDAKDLIEEIEDWAPKSLSESWSLELSKRLEAEEGQFTTLRGRLKLRGGEMDPQRILSQVRHKRARAYTSGGVVAQYTRGRELPADLIALRVKGEASLGDAPSGARGVALSGSRRKPGVLAWRPELLVCQRIRVRLELRAATGALLIGVDGKGQDGVGISFGGSKSELGRRRLDRGADEEPLDGPLEIEIVLGGSARPRLACKAGDTPRAIEINADRLDGHVALCVDAGEAWIVKFEVAGIAK